MCLGVGRGLCTQAMSNNCHVLMRAVSYDQGSGHDFWVVGSQTCILQRPLAADKKDLG